MVIECSNCHARYNVDERKIPPGGVKVKCHKCQHIIVIRKEPPHPEPVSEPAISERPRFPESQPSVPPPEPPPAVPEPPGVPEPEVSEPVQPSMPAAKPAQPEPQEGPTEPSFPDAPSEQPTPVTPEVEPPAPEPPEQTPPDMPGAGHASAPAEPGIQAPGYEVTAPAEEPVPPAAEMSEEDKKWNARARRLAKALASDLVLYNQDKVEEGLRNGTLANLLGPEIRRSWEYYCQQIPKHIIESTDHFKDQLNKIVGKGKEIFK